LALAQQFTGFAMVVFDASFTLVGYALGDTLHTRAFQETLKRGYAMGASEEHQRRYRQNLSTYPHGFEAVLEELERKTPLWVLPFQTCHAKTYFLHIILGREQYRGLRALADSLVNELCSVLERQEGLRDHAAASNFVAELVTMQLSEQQARWRANFLGWPAADSYLVVRAESFGMSHPTSQLEELCASIRREFPRLRTAVIDNGIAGLVEKEGDAHVDATLFSTEMEELLAREGMRLVISDPVRELSAVSAIHRDLREALAVMWRNFERGELSCERHAVPYDDCKLRLLTDALQRTADKHDVVPDFLKRVQAYDARQGADFERTLTAYIRNMKSKADTCAALNIHRSTLEYRLNRLRDFFSIDLNDERVISYIQMLTLANQRPERQRL
jgi:sugar diacid utilization regulator